ncbi:MAG TPA: RNA degradosome polyphosphate kinase, partial [Polyangia bacterium]|nr:RNA degradosome polyphosphate kinase [Polyangia bacterium]
GEEQMFLSSADWMPRNLHRRVEVLFPVEAAPLREQLRREVLEPALGDTAHAYDMSADGTYARRTPRDGEPARSAQIEVLERTVGRAAEEARAASATPPVTPPERSARAPRAETAAVEA